MNKIVREYVAIYGQEAYERELRRADTPEALEENLRKAVEGQAVWVYFKFLGIDYRTNRDATLVERNDGKRLGWVRTDSRRVQREAERALGKR